MRRLPFFLSIFSHSRRVRLWSFVAAATCTAWIFATLPAAGQDRIEGMTVLTDWPPQHERTDLGHQVLPFIDSLFVGYAYGTENDDPYLHMALEWLPSGQAIIRGERRQLSDVRVEMVAVELEVGVFVDDNRTATLSVVVDSMTVGPSPDFVEINLPNLEWSNVFVDVSEEEARALFERRFELRDPEFMHVAFALYESDTTRTGEARMPARRPVPREVTVYGRRTRTDVVFDLVWLLGGSVRVDRGDDGTPRGRAGRGSSEESPRSRAGRSSEDRGRDQGDEIAEREDRSAEREGSREREGRGILDLIPDEDDDDDKTLVPYAVAAVGAAGLLAVAGGTIGYFGNARHARYGVTSGLVRRGGGILLQVGVNEALLADDDRPKRLMARLLAFVHLFGGSIQPAIGAGILATNVGSDLTTEPSLAIGGVARRRVLLFYGGYDVIQRGPEFSVALNVHELWRSHSGD